jgi:hypothetical protein
MLMLLLLLLVMVVVLHREGEVRGHHHFAALAHGHALAHTMPHALAHTMPHAQGVKPHHGDAAHALSHDWRRRKRVLFINKRVSDQEIDGLQALHGGREVIPHSCPEPSWRLSGQPETRSPEECQEARTD